MHNRRLQESPPLSEVRLASLVDIEGREGLISAVERLVNHQFRDANLLIQALTHSSYSNENSTHAENARREIPDNERFEFLGDAVIGLVVAKALMERFPDACEGRLSRWRSSLVSRKTLAEISLELRMGDLILLGRGERRTGGAEKRSILAAVLEAVVGAVYVDGGLEKATEFLEDIYQGWFDRLLDGDDSAIRMLDRKTHLQERTQQVYRSTPEYRLVESWGAEHEKNFRVEILIAGEVVARGDGRSKKEAEQSAAQAALEVLGF